MAESRRDVRPKRLRYFYLNGLLYKAKRQEKRNNLMYALDARDHKLTAFLISDVRNHSQRAFDIKDACKMLGCQPLTLRRYERDGKVSEVQRWTSDLSNPKNLGRRKYSEDHLRELREAMSEVSIGRPRFDGMIVPRDTLPSAAELEAMLRGEDVFYIKDGNDFVPLWKAKF
jgi:hypothetical protein